MGDHNFHGELSFCDLRSKEIVNTYDGRRLGRIIDIIFSCHGGAVLGIVVPYCRRIFFARSQDIFIPWRCICKIGEDVILVDIGDGVPGIGGNRRRRNNYRDNCQIPFEHCFDECCEIHQTDSVDTKQSPKESCRDKQNDNHRDGPDCDRKCEKCMLFDCAHRWKNC